MNVGDGIYRHGETPHMSATYRYEYEGMRDMKAFDEEKNRLKRWFENFKMKYSDWFVSSTEWLVVEEVEWFSTRVHKIKKRFVCKIGSDHPGHMPRTVVMDHTTPPAPFLFLAAKTPYVPPPPKTAEDIRREDYWRREEERQFRLRIEQEREAFRELRYSMRRMPMPRDFDFDPRKWERTREIIREPIYTPPIFAGIDMATSQDRTVVITRERSTLIDFDPRPTTPAPPRHRRNVG